MMLDVRDLEVWYGEAQAVRGVSFQVVAGDLVAIIGANGAGKTSILRALMGLERPRRGTITLEGTPITDLPAHARARRGMVLVPEGRRILPEFTVEENLRLGAYAQGNGAALARAMEEAFGLFPRLAERRGQPGRTLSGGEQQMLAIARALMARPRLLLLDEVSLGLMPTMVAQAFATMRDLHRRGVTILLVEQNARMALGVATRGYVLETGAIALQGTGAELAANPQVQRAYLGG
ncbi:MAG TPA: ABC transporter ATP-binding protein [Candidatus Methylomirabilis sp.]|jgi:branched-chain amino acid transport system ATP-binding protein